MADKRRRAQVTEGIIIFALFAFSLLLLFNLNLLSWPLGQTVGSQQNPNSEFGSRPVQPGYLQIGTFSENVTIPYNSVSKSGPLVSNLSAAALSKQAVPDVQIYVSKSGAKTPFVTGFTGPNGLLFEMLPPDFYTVSIQDSRFSNLSVVVQIAEGYTTSMNTILNETRYLTTSFNLIDSDSSNWIGSWNEVFAQVATNAPIPSGSGIRTSLAVSSANPQERSGSGSSSSSFLVPVSITGTSLGNSSQWVQLKVGRFMNIQGINNIALITDQVSYTVTISAAS